MTLARLLVFALLGVADGPDPAALAADLGSTDAAVRDEAAGALEELGRPALPALHRLRDADDADLRRQAEQLIDLIERQRLLRATRVRLDLDGATLADAAESLRAQAGFPIELTPSTAGSAARADVHPDGPIAFWSTLDRLRAPFGVRHDPGPPFHPPPRLPVVRLVRADGPPPPASDAGPFRTYLVLLTRHREIRAPMPGGEPKVRDTLEVDLHVVAEPGLVVWPTGPVVLEEVVDDRGRDLRPDPPVGPISPRGQPPRFEEAEANLFPLRLPLRPAAGPGVGRLRRLRGYVPIAVIARADDPASAPIGDAPGTPTPRGGIDLAIGDVVRTGGATSLVLTVRGERPAILAPATTTGLGPYQPPYRIEDHVVVRDAGGAVLWWNAARAEAGAGGLSHRLTVQGGPPTRVEYHSIVGAATELGFEFADVPLP